MKATVNFNDDGHPTGMDVTEGFSSGQKAHFKLGGGVATLTSVTPADGEDRIYADVVSAMMEYAERLSFVDSTELESHAEELLD